MQPLYFKEYSIKIIFISSIHDKALILKNPSLMYQKTFHWN